MIFEKSNVSAISIVYRPTPGISCQAKTRFTSDPTVAPLAGEESFTADRPAMMKSASRRLCVVAPEQAAKRQGKRNKILLILPNADELRAT